MGTQIENKDTDREVLHKLLDYLLDNGEDSGLVEKAEMEELFHMRIKRFWLKFKIEEEIRGC